MTDLATRPLRHRDDAEPRPTPAARGPEPGLVHDRFAARAAASPDRVAVTSSALDDGATLSYRELAERSATLADRLRAAGVRVEDRVAVELPRGASAVTVFLAVLAAGGCYVPIDPAYPEARKELLRTDAGCVLTIRAGDGGEPELIPGDRPTGEARPAERVAIHPDNAAYVIYTSGSTGRPKGVVVSHRNICGLVDDQRLDVSPGDVVAHLAPTSFDAATFEIWSALTRGGTIAVLPGRLSVAELTERIRELAPDWLFLTTGLFHLVVDQDLDALSAVGTVLTGGDVLSPTLFRRARGVPRRRLYAAYGPTETTTFASLHAADGTSEGSVPIGSPLDQARFGTAGTGIAELLVGGGGVARGYHDQPRLTAERFVPDPAGAPGSRRYRTGDRAEADGGAFRFHGRIDRQVKIRGHRIELAEIETVLAGHPDVRQVAVRAFDVGSDSATVKRLGAFVSPAAGRTVSASALRGYLTDRLPEYMLPSVFTVLADLPLDPNGKPDRSALPYPWARRAEMTELDAYVPPGTALEELLCEVWAETLGLDQVGTTDNYYLLGGDSLRSVDLLGKLRRRDIQLAAHEFFSHQSVGELAELIESTGRRDRTQESAA